MENSQTMQPKASQQSCNPILTLGGRVSQGTTLTVLAVAVVGSGLVLGWDSLVALGLSTFIIALLPCAVMCALGLCASRMGKKEAAPAAPGLPPKEAQPPAVETMANAEPAAEMMANAQPAAEMVANVQPAAEIAANAQRAAVEEAKSA